MVIPWPAGREDGWKRFEWLTALPLKLT